MKLFAAAATMVCLSGVGLAAPTTAAAILQEIAPTSNQCDASHPECRTADQAAPFLIRAMQQYKVYHNNEIAAILALMAFESVDFKYKHNVSPGRPGQGTANMQSASFNLEYAKSIPALQSKVADIPSVSGLSDDKLNDILALVTPDKYNFGSGPWFYSTQCSADVHSTLQQSADEGFKAYMGCVGIPSLTSDRLAYFARAKQAFGITQ